MFNLEELAKVDLNNGPFIVRIVKAEADGTQVFKRITRFESVEKARDYLHLGATALATAEGFTILKIEPEYLSYTDTKGYKLCLTIQFESSVTK